jgi:hypothetical protein
MILSQQCHVVVGSHLHLVVRTQRLTRGYRQRYAVHHRQYSARLPFTERFFVGLAVSANASDEAGFVG